MADARHRILTPRPSFAAVALVPALLAVTPLVTASGTGAPTATAIVIEGRGWGHGVGMPQDGAYELATRGRSATSILGTFYPGTGIGSSGGSVRVRVAASPAGSGVVLGFPTGGTVHGSGATRGLPMSVPAGGSVRIAQAPDGSYTVSPEGAATRGRVMLQSQPADEQPDGAANPLPTLTTSAQPSPDPQPTTPPSGPNQPPPPPPASPAASATPTPTAAPAATSAGPVTAAPTDGGTTTVAATTRSYRGALRVLQEGPDLAVVNQLALETYLRGLAEVPASWPQAVLQAQVIAARSYAVNARAAAAGAYDLLDDERSQVYRGVGGESAAQDRAVAATAGQVLVHDGRIVNAVYSASAGGITASPLEGFGTSARPEPYLVVVRYPTRDPAPYRVQLTVRELGRRLGYDGTLTDAAVVRRGPSGRALTVRVTGTAGTRDLVGIDVQRQLGLRSTLYELTPVGPAGSSAVPRPLASQQVTLAPVPEVDEPVTGTGGQLLTTAPPRTLPPVEAVVVASMALAGSAALTVLAAVRTRRWRARAAR